MDGKNSSSIDFPEVKQHESVSMQGLDFMEDILSAKVIDMT